MDCFVTSFLAMTALGDLPSAGAFLTILMPDRIV
jgi:hypothetical protein